MKKQRKTEAVWIESQQRWRVRVQIDGQRKPFYSPTPGRRGKAEAERKADAWVESGKTDKLRFGEAFEKFIEPSTLCYFDFILRKYLVNPLV